MLALAVARVSLVGGPQFFNDSYQYLSIAENLRHRLAIETSVVHFDDERARDRLPAPETTFPPGYPLLIWALSLGRLPPEWIGLLISLASAVGVLPLLRAAAMALDLPVRESRFILVLWAGSAQASLYGITLYAESVFTVLCVAAVVLLLEHGRDEGAASWRVPVACLLAGAAFWMRYAGLFFVVAFHAHALVCVWRDRTRLTTWGVSLAACDALVALLMARNMAVAGTWTGGNARPVYRGAREVLHRVGVGLYELSLGSIRDPRSLPFGLFALLLCLGVAGAAALLLHEWASARRVRIAATRDQYTLLLLCVVIYCGAMIYAGFTRQISLGARMFVPVFPGLALLAGLVGLPSPTWAAASRRWWTSLFLAPLMVGYLGANAQSALGRPRVAEHRTVAEALALPMEGGRPLLQWLEETVPRDGIVLAVEGQATAYVLKRKTISAVGRLFTTLTWDEEQTRRTTRRFGANFVIVYPAVVASGGVDGLDSRLFRDLAARRPPDWLELAAVNPRVLVYRVRP